MYIPWWLRWWSYVTEVHVESTSSSYNEELHVSIVEGRYQLTTPTAIYSWGDKYDNFKQVFELMRLEELDVRDVLVLGLGLGSIPYMLERMGHRYRYTGVEIDEEVIYLASKYVINGLASDIDIVQADASSFVILDTGLYDLITMDVFIGHEVPAAFLDDRFVQALAASMTDNGVLIFNMLARNTDDVTRAMLYYESFFLPVFPDATFVHVKGNLMLLSDEKALRQDH